MTFSFVNGTSKEELAARILWYVKNGNCSIMRDLIYLEPVQLIVNDIIPPTTPDPVADESDEEEDTQDSEADADENDEDEEEADVDTIAVAPATSQQIYERRNIDKWFKETGSMVDPISKREVITTKSFINSPDLSFESDDVLNKLSFFIKTYLTALQDHITTGNLAEVDFWLTAWELAKNCHAAQSAEDFRAEEVGISEVFENKDIMLPSGRRISTQAYAQKQTALLEHLKINQDIVYKHSPFRAFMSYINTMQDLPEISETECAEKLHEYMQDALTTTPMDKLLNTTIIADIEDEASDDETMRKYMYMRPLQIAVVHKVVHVVKTLIMLGAKPYIPETFNDYVFEDIIYLDPAYEIELNLDYAKILELPQCEKAEFFLAIESESRSMLQALKPIYLYSLPSLVVNEGVFYVICQDNADLLACLLEDYGLIIDPTKILYYAICKSLSPKIVGYLIENLYLQQSGEASTIEHLLAEMLNQFDLDVESENIGEIIALLIKFACPMYSNLFRKFGPELQQKIHISNNVHDLVQQVLNKKTRLIACGQLVNNLYDRIGMVLKENLYFVLYEQYSLIANLNVTQRNMLIDRLASGSIEQGFYAPERLRNTLQDFASAMQNPPAPEQLTMYSENTKRLKLI